MIGRTVSGGGEVNALMYCYGICLEGLRKTIFKF